MKPTPFAYAALLLLVTFQGCCSKWGNGQPEQVSVVNERPNSLETKPAHTLRELADKIVQHGKQELDAGHFEIAYNTFRAAVNFDPDNAEARRYLGIATGLRPKPKPSEVVRGWYPTDPPRPIR